MSNLNKSEARLDILKIHSRKMNLTRGINMRKIAEMIPGIDIKIFFKKQEQLTNFF